jgi:Caspase domain/Anaphase-promoting complex subunit 4 WD40 domain
MVDVEIYDASSGKRLGAHLGREGVVWTRLNAEGTLAASAVGELQAIPNGVVTNPRTLLLWDPRSGAEIARLEIPGSAGARPGGSRGDFSPDGRWLAAAVAGPEVRVWNVATRAVAARLSDGLTSVKAIAFDASGGRLAIAGEAGEVRIHELPSGDRVASFGCAGARVRGMALSPDATRVALACQDGSVKLLDAATGAPLATLVLYPDGDWLTLAPSLHYVGTAGAARRAQVVIGGASYPLELFASTLQKPEAVAQALEGHPVAPALVPSPPEVEFLTPEARETTSAERGFVLKARASDPALRVDHVDVAIDGQALPAEEVELGVQRETGERGLRLELPIEIPAGKSQVTVSLQAVSVRGTRSPVRTRIVRYEPPRRELYLLAMGVADYRDKALELAYPVEDVDDLIAALTAQEGPLYKAVHVERLVDAAVTPAAVHRLRETFLLRAQPEDTIVVFAAGHGVRAASGEYYFLTSQATPQDSYAGIDRETLESLVTWNRLHAARRVLLLDTCQSGVSLDGARGIGIEQGPYDEADADLALESSEGGLYILAATSQEGFAREQEGNGLFTRGLCDGLAGAADDDGDGWVRIEELARYVARTVHEQSGGRQRPTIPTVRGGENFPIARVPAAGHR